mmetsp:Transcript_13546/g.19992  ORF Transcript_13546/g.19992 Transcript_13546/m.19992 type:complete len:330 (-) Transcript_13546:208-1197(-)
MNDFISRILYDPTATTDARSERHLAVALGYPSTWRVCRRLIPVSDGEDNCNAQPKLIQDVIYAGNPNKDVDRWYCHEAAQLASTEFKGDSPCFQFEGGHMTQQLPKFQKGDKVEVRYSRKWYAAEILKRKAGKKGIKYTVLYTEDNSSQENVREVNIRLAPPDSSAYELAGTLGLPEGWKATKNNKRFIFESPDGLTFRNKKSALAHVKETVVEGEDPPWRAAGHELIGKFVLHTHIQKLSGARSLSIDQIGKVVGWISDSDTDRQGQPGYVSEKTNAPAALFHVAFEEAPGHAYPKYLLEYQDLEENEIREILMPEDEEPKSKRPRTN